MYMGLLETRNFEFRAFGKTRDQVMVLLQSAAFAHSKEYRCDPQYFLGLLSDDDNVRWTEVHSGRAYRDDVEIVPNRNTI
jgi:hypothetical protein